MKNKELTETEMMVNTWLNKLSLEDDSFSMNVRQLEIVFRTLKFKIEEDKRNKRIR